MQALIGYPSENQDWGFKHSRRHNNSIGNIGFGTMFTGNSNPQANILLKPKFNYV